MLVAAGGVLFALVASKLSDRFPIPAPALFLLAAAAIPVVVPEVRSRRTNRGRRADRHSLRRRDAHRLATVPPCCAAHRLARHRGHLRNRRADGGLRPLSLRLRLDDGLDHRRRPVAHRSGRHVLDPREQVDPRAHGHDPRGRIRRERPRRHRPDDRHPRVRDRRRRIGLDDLHRLRRGDDRRARDRRRRRGRAPALHAPRRVAERRPLSPANARRRGRDLRPRVRLARLGLPGGLHRRPRPG